MTSYFSRNGRKRMTLLAIVAASAGTAHAETATEMNVGLNARASSNPFLDRSDSDVVLSAALTVNPALVVEDEISTFRLEADLNIEQYAERYGNELSGQLGATARRELSEYTSVNVGISALTSRSNFQNGFFANPGDLLDPVFDPVIPVGDLSNSGRRNRQSSLSAQFGVDHRLSEIDSIALDGYVGLNKNGGALQDDSRSMRAQLRYARRLSPQTSVAANVSAGVNTNLGDRFGDSRYLTPKIEFTQRLSETLRATVGAGVSFTRTNDVAGLTNSRRALAFNASLCDRRLHSGWCADFSREAQPTTLGGVTIATSANVSYDMQISAVDQLSFSARYTDNRPTAETILFNPNGARKAVGASGQYARRINDRLSAVINSSYTRFLDDLLERKPSFQFSAGINYYFGKLR